MDNSTEIATVFVVVVAADGEYCDWSRENVLGVHASLDGAQASLPDVTHGKKRITVDGWRQGPDGVWWWTRKSAKTFHEGWAYIAERPLLP